ncbi:hypothetical protein EV05_1759 [Prochlorococcus sp. MIT 0601]|nr:hypothetical protein EV05_1759 [Prochlorococcus sp. MIT 0601]
MDCMIEKCPDWLVDRFKEAGGVLTFFDFMDLALNDSDHGAYSRGTISIGKKGDFVTSPSLSPDFAEFIAIQLIEWFEQLQNTKQTSDKLTLIDAGAGEGDLTLGLISAFKKLSPSLISHIEFILIEINEAMKKRQQLKLQSINDVSINWKTLEELSNNRINGVLIAHELLDTFPVERIILRKDKVFQQGLKLIEKGNKYYYDYTDLDLPPMLIEFLDQLTLEIGFSIPPEGAEEGWSTELHTGYENWFSNLASIFNHGIILVIDYALESSRYYNPIRNSGTIISYKNQIASSNILNDPGECDITSHLCIESMQLQASRNNWKSCGFLKQGEALLALGLAEKISELSFLESNQLGNALIKREALLRLVDPRCLGNFKWHVFEFNKANVEEESSLKTKFLNDPK